MHLGPKVDPSNASEILRRLQNLLIRQEATCRNLKKLSVKGKTAILDLT